VATSLFSDVFADQRVAAVLSGRFRLLAADRQRLPAHPALVYAGDFAGSGAGANSGSVRKIPLVGLAGFDLPQPVAEGAAIVPGRVSDQQIAIYVARRGKAYEPTDEVRFTDSLGIYNSQAFAEDAMAAHELALTSSIAGVVGGFGLQQSTTGVALTVATFLAAIGKLEAGSQASVREGQAMGVLYPQQIAHLRDSWATASSGVLQWHPTGIDILKLQSAGFIGRIFGVDVFSSSYVPTANAGADSAGGIFAPLGIVWGDMTPIADMADQVVLAKTLFERGRNSLTGTTAYVSTSWHGVTRGYDTAPHQMGVGVITKRAA
jgi:hypothetical protein